MSQKIITILGPTASGKTKLAIELARKYHGRIICADSRTIYKGMDIGTAKPTAAECRLVKHYLLDMIEPNQSFSAKDFKIAANQAMVDINKTGSVPFLVGGSGMYLDAVLFDYQFRNPRRYPDKILDKKSLAELVELATNKYPNSITKINTKNRRRVEQLILKGPAKDDDRQELKVDSLIIGLKPNMAYLRGKIALRTNLMLDKGFVQEVESLRKKYGSDCAALQTTGYFSVGRYLDGEINLEELKAEITKTTFNLAKKQMTWFKRNKYICWLDDVVKTDEIVNNYLKKDVK